MNKASSSMTGRALAVACAVSFAGCPGGPVETPDSGAAGGGSAAGSSGGGASAGGVAGGAGPGGSGRIELATVVTADSRVAEFDLTGSQARVRYGTGASGDFDGLYDVNDPTTMYGRGLDVFPREGNFVVGSLRYNVADAGALNGTFPVSALDLAGLWADDSATSDISAAALSVWLFGRTVQLRFGPIDAADTVTFSNGVLTSLDVEVTAELSVDFAAGLAPATVYDGRLTLTGNRLSLSMDDTVEDVRTARGVQPRSRFVIDVSGVVSAVGR
jgi:hypothetical protein